MTFFGDNGDDNLRSTKRERTIFSTMAVGHILAILIPFALISWGFWEPEQPEELSINIVDEASVGPVVAMETTRLPFEENPTPDVIPEPTPEPPAPEPIPTPPPVPAEPSFDIPKMPTVVEEAPAPKPTNAPKPIPQKIVAQPKFDMPKLPTPKAKPKPKDERVFTPVDTKVKSSNNANELVPIGNQDAAQRYGETFSNTPQGGKNRSDQYTAKLGGFLKMHWRNYAPSRAELGGIDFEAKIALHIDGSGRLISGTIIKSSGNPIMDAAVRRMLNNLNQYPMPDDRKPVKISSITITLE